MFGIIRSEFQCLEEIRSEFLCLKGSDHNSNVWKSKVNILMFKEMRSEFQYWRKKVTIPVFGRIRSESKIIHWFPFFFHFTLCEENELRTRHSFFLRFPPANVIIIMFFKYMFTYCHSFPQTSPFHYFQSQFLQCNNYEERRKDVKQISHINKLHSGNYKLSD